jgi:hypothetical protein
LENLLYPIKFFEYDLGLTAGAAQASFDPWLPPLFFGQIGGWRKNKGAGAKYLFYTEDK